MGNFNLGSNYRNVEVIEKAQNIKRLTPYFPCADVCGTWSSSMDPIYVSEATGETKK